MPTLNTRKTALELKNASLQTSENLASHALKGNVVRISSHLREAVHDINNSLFVAKGFMEELRSDVLHETFLSEDYDLKTFKGMFEAVARNIEKLDHSVQSIRDFAKQGIFKEPFSALEVVPSEL